MSAQGTGHTFPATVKSKRQLSPPRMHFRPPFRGRLNNRLPRRLVRSLRLALSQDGQVPVHPRQQVLQLCDGLRLALEDAVRVSQAIHRHLPLLSCHRPAAGAQVRC